MSYILRVPAKGTSYKRSIYITCLRPLAKGVETSQPGASETISEGRGNFATRGVWYSRRFCDTTTMALRCQRCLLQLLYSYELSWPCWFYTFPPEVVIPSYSLRPRYTMPLFLSHVGFSIPTSQLFKLVHFHRLFLLTLALVTTGTF